MGTTPYMGIPFPDDEDDPFLIPVEAFFNGVDAWLQTISELGDLILSAPKCSFVLTGDVWNWGADITFTSPRTNEVITVAAGALTLLVDQYAYVVPSVHPLTTETLVPVAGAFVPRGAIVLAHRNLYGVALGRDNAVDIYSLISGGSGWSTGTIANGGGVETGSFYLGVRNGRIGKLAVEAGAATVNSDIEFFSDAGLTDMVYQALAADCSTTAFVDLASWPVAGWKGELIDGLLYYRITNNGANPSRYSIEMEGSGTI